MPGLAWSLFHLQRPQEAVTFFIKSIECKPQANNFYGLAKASYRCFQKEETLAVIKDAKKRYRQEPRLLKNILNFEKEITTKKGNARNIRK